MKGIKRFWATNARVCCVDPPLSTIHQSLMENEALYVLASDFDAAEARAREAEERAEYYKSKYDTINATRPYQSDYAALKAERDKLVATVERIRKLREYHDVCRGSSSCDILDDLDAALAETGTCETCGGTGHIKIAYPLDAIGTYRYWLCSRCAPAPGVPARDEREVVVCEGKYDHADGSVNRVGDPGRFFDLKHAAKKLGHLDGQRIQVIIRPLVAKAEEPAR